MNYVVSKHLGGVVKHGKVIDTFRDGSSTRYLVENPQDHGTYTCYPEEVTHHFTDRSVYEHHLKSNDIPLTLN